MAKSYEIVSPIRELRSSLGELRLNDLAVGRDGRNRTILSAFRSRTGRNQPSNSRFIFGPIEWLRGLIEPPPGHGVAYVDWSQQEFGIAAALSGDRAMLAAYESGDPDLAFASRRVPTGIQRELFEAMCARGPIRSGRSKAWRSGSGNLALSLGTCCAHHRETYRQFWTWSDAIVDAAMLTGSLHTVFGWHMHLGEAPNPRSVRNFPMQANAAEVTAARGLPCHGARDRGVWRLVHDAFLICAPLDRLEPGYRRHARGHGGGVTNCAQGLRAPDRREACRLSQPVHGSARRSHVAARDGVVAAETTTEEDGMTDDDTEEFGPERIARYGIRERKVMSGKRRRRELFIWCRSRGLSGFLWPNIALAARSPMSFCAAI